MRFTIFPILFFFSIVLFASENTNLDPLWRMVRENYKTNPALAIDYAMQLQELAKDADLKMYGDATRVLGIITRNQGDLSASVRYFFDALSTYQAIEDAPNMAVCTYNIAQVFKKSGDYANALPYYEVALKHNITADRKEAIVSTYYQMGFCSAKLGEFEKAREYLNTAFELSEINNPKLTLDILNVLGMSYFDQEDFTNALSYYEKVNELSARDNKTRKLGMALHNMAESWFELGDIPKAGILIEKALILRELDGDPDWILSSLVLHTRIAHSTETARPFISDLKTGIEAVASDQINDELIEALDLVNTLIKDNQYADAFPRAYMIKVMDKLNGQNKLLFDLTQTLYQVKNQYALQLVVEGYQLEEENKALRSSKTRTAMILGGSLAGLIIFFGIMYFVLRKRKQDAYNKLVKLDQDYRHTYQSYKSILEEFKELQIRHAGKDKVLRDANEQMTVLNNMMADMNEMHLTLMMHLGIKGRLPPMPPFDDFGKHIN